MGAISQNWQGWKQIENSNIQQNINTITLLVFKKDAFKMNANFKQWGSGHRKNGILICLCFKWLLYKNNRHQEATIKMFIA